MKRYTPLQYNNVISKLPQEVRDVVLSNDTTEHLWKIGEKHSLHIDKVGIMHDIAMDTMMGIIATKNFVKELQDSLEISALDASVLARDIDENIFRPIKKTMTDLYAGGAPYKPSSSLVQFYEEDDEHKTLSKADILKEIEDPSDAPVRKEVANTSLGLRAKSLEGDVKKAASKEIVEYHEELVNTDNSHIADPKQTIPATPKTLSTGETITAKTEIVSESQKSSQLQAPSSKPDLTPTDFLNKITSLKLSNAFVMPKGGNAINELKDVEVPAVRYDALANSGVRVNDISLHPVIKEEGSKFASLSGGEERVGINVADLKQPNPVTTFASQFNIPSQATSSDSILTAKTEIVSDAQKSSNLQAPSSKPELAPSNPPAKAIDPYRERI
jgi:hypothetical protein